MNKKHHQGFTLVEVLIAMAVFAILAVLAYGGLEQVIKNKEKTAESLHRLKDLQMTMTKINRDLTQLSSRHGRDEQGDMLTSLSAGQGNELLIQLTRNGWRNPARINRGNLQRVAYRLDEDKLIRTTWPYVDRALDNQSVETILIDNIKNASLRFLDDKNEWHTSWPALNATSSGDTALPVAIEFTLEMEDWGNIVRIMRSSG
ncbi:MAG: type II secretion system minor pseudopilin GspJ [Gammaproteobacteria bacterium]|nr:type II secretion system minor pseudopilin GspJ [Gammaproteobacteria bacterium]MCW9003800.1 type II secretion system minor pseudopilin GspJ [Gammaproteobacteria bacterium]